MKKKKSIQIVLLCIILLSIIFVTMGLWAVDIGISGMLNTDGFITNGWFVREPTQQYHIGLWFIEIGITLIAIVSFVLVVNVDFEKMGK